jgi:TIR domain/HEAT repeats
LNIDWGLDSRLVGEVKPEFQKKTVGFVEVLELPDWLKTQSLGTTRSDNAIPGLDSDSDGRRITAEALGEIGSEAAIPGLLKLLEDSNSGVRWSAAVAFGNIVKNYTDTIAPHLPHLLTLIPTDSGQDAYRIILAIQESCKFYNSDLTQTTHSMKLFFSYSHKDETLRDELAKHLSQLKRQNIITTWHDRDITAGTDWAQAIDDNLNTADIILLLVSADFLASDYCYEKEMQRAIERHNNQEARVIPIILRPCDWHSAPFSNLQSLPIAHGAGAKPVTTWDNQDEAFLAIAQGIRKAVEELQQHRNSSLRAE